MKPRVEFNLNRFCKNIDILFNETKGITYIFPVKCCNEESVLNIVSNKGFGFDVSNLSEIKIIEKFLDGRFVSASGPLSSELLQYKYNNIHVIANHKKSFVDGMGIRINFNSSRYFDYSRFGEDYTKLEDSFCNKIKYIHFHNSDKRTIEKCDNICQEFKKVMLKFPNLEYINIGGHLEDLTFEEGIHYLNNIRKIIPNKIKLIVEAGDFLFKDCGKLFCSVVDVRYDDECQVVTLNFSKMANQRWAYPQILCNTKEAIKTVFYGCSCCETDVYLETKFKKLNIGDSLVFTNISPYSYQWNTGFNGVEKLDYIFIK